MSGWIGIATNPDNHNYVYADYEFDVPAGAASSSSFELTLTHDDTQKAGHNTYFVGA